jgi:hypothetical protein
MNSIIKVDAEGICAAGEFYDHAAQHEMVAAGYMVNRPVLLQYPDGRMVEGTQVRVTDTGMAFLAKKMGRSQ